MATDVVEAMSGADDRRVLSMLLMGHCHVSDNLPTGRNSSLLNNVTRCSLHSFPATRSHIC